MTLKLIQEQKRIDFLKEFTKELIITSAEKYEEQKIENRIKAEKIKQKFVSPITPEQAFQKIIKIPPFRTKYSREIESEDKMEKPLVHELPLETPVINPFQEKPAVQLKKQIRPMFPRRKLINRWQINRMPSKKYAVQSNNTATRALNSPQSDALRTIQPESSSLPSGFNLGKIESLLKDSSVQSVECLGPGKNILIKRYNKLNQTAILLTQEEIGSIIQEFSKKAKIPLVRGILKAAVGNFVISAIESNYAGSRFIISKINLF